MDASLITSLEGILAIIMVLIAIIVLKRMQARTRSKTDAPDIILRQDEDDGDQGR